MNTFKEYLPIYLSPISKIIGIVFSFLGLLGCTIIIILLYNNEPDPLQFIQKIDNPMLLPYLIPFITSSIFLIVGLITLMFYSNKKKKIKKILKNGNRISAKVTRNIQNFHVKQNGVPKREVTFKSDLGDLYDFKFFGEEIAHLLKENSIVKIITMDKNKAIPAPEFYEELIDSNQDSNHKTNLENQKNEAFDKWVSGAETFKKNGDLDAAASFYESALNYKNDKLIALHLLDLYKKLKEPDKEKQLREKIKNWN